MSALSTLQCKVHMPPSCHARLYFTAMAVSTLSFLLGFLLSGTSFPVHLFFFLVASFLACNRQEHKTDEEHL